jgi:signal transduction histidine kinase
MTLAQIETALKPFAQLQSHFNRTQEGTGLGLSLASGLAKLHGGSLRFDSEPGDGTTVILSLPAGAKTPEGGP